MCKNEIHFEIRFFFSFSIALQSQTETETVQKKSSLLCVWKWKGRQRTMYRKKLLHLGKWTSTFLITNIFNNNTWASVWPYNIGVMAVMHWKSFSWMLSDFKWFSSCCCCFQKKKKYLESVNFTGVDLIFN